MRAQSGCRPQTAWRWGLVSKLGWDTCLDRLLWDITILPRLERCQFPLPFEKDRFFDNPKARNPVD